MAGHTPNNATNHKLTSVLIRRALHKLKKHLLISTLLAVTLAATAAYLWVNESAFSTSTNDHNSLSSVKVTTRKFSTNILLSGRLAPLEDVPITAPFQGILKKVFFEYNTKVTKGTLLAAMETDEIERQLRTTKAEQIKSAQKLKELENWERGPEVISARRSCIKAKIGLENAHLKLQENKFLFEKGIISGNELRASEQDYNDRESTLLEAEESFKTTLAQGSRDNIEMARLELTNAQTLLQSLTRKLDNEKIIAPVDGVILEASGDSTKTLEPGRSVDQGELLFTIGNITGLSVKSRADEADINNIHLGQRVEVSGDGFDFIMQGTIRHISSNAAPSDKNERSYGMPAEGAKFEIVAVIENVPAELQSKLRLGMTSTLKIITYENPAALVIPIQAVTVAGSQRTVKILDSRTGNIIDHPISTGRVSGNFVEVADGIEHGQEIFIVSPAHKKLP
ncbi:efflux RND transporter periplasmic adaptor subunit [Desulfovibrio psychrotolerans]|uniref:RND transporter n=1 Tax=Desulfovibrio psychrotolerans TaxID=415242 RepID=A0A7J0BVY4_9BACT|nr:HlyD family efflux transporter periplasmic adaptor subunit [Desulfovibrio psychrotolerans]GFM37876.1 hypothetical protein DSM19430T_25600 [Desulfovibrio psychrotolerans]